ncbi:MAG: Zn-dependent hydrolase, partial [Clostridia bacterium]|nr:Zn-dependent hydrolase [Clostridia bacterium]
PYIDICKLLTSYKTVEPERVTALWGSLEKPGEPLVQIGFFDFGELHFEVYEGKGGHLPGEIVLIDYKNHIAFTGDIYINTHGLTPEQAKYNQYAPILMTSVDTDPALCAEERRAITQRLGVGKWQIFGAHGFKKDYSVNV